MGANVPLKDAACVANLKTPDYVYTHLTSVANNFNLEKFLLNYHQKLPNFKLVVSGLLTSSYKKQLPNNVHFKKSLPDVMEYISSL